MSEKGSVNGVGLGVTASDPESTGRSNLRLNCRSYAEFKRQRGHMFTGPA